METMASGTLIKEVTFNWFSTNENGEEYGLISTERMYRYQGVDGRSHEYERPESQLADKIVYHESQGPGDQHYCHVYMKDGRSFRIFNINQVTYFPKTE